MIRLSNFTLGLSLAAALVGPACLAAAGSAQPAPAPNARPASLASAPELPSEQVEFFEKKIRPLLAQKCYACHSAASRPVAGDLLLDSREGVLKGGATGAALMPGQPAKSLLIKAVRHEDSKLKMPPGPKLSDAEIADLEAWVKMGAPDPRRAGAAAVTAQPEYDFAKERQFWSFRPLQQPKVPAVKDTKWPRSDIDRFLLAKLEAKGLKPQPVADRRTLIRRVTFDLTGLPPTPEEVRDFLADRSPDAWKKVVERLLASPQYGERWGRHWLDLVRYADTAGCNSDFPVPTAYKYRNYVIQSFNQDRPYNQFLTEQLAGDLMPSKSEAERHERIIATGYLAISRRFASNVNEFHLTLDDSIDNVGKTMLGLSVSCARCHDHKFDPIPNEDYYALYGILRSSKYAFPGVEVVPAEKDLVYLASPEQAAAAQKYDTELNELGPKIRSFRRDVRELEDAAERAARAAGESAPAAAGSGETRTPAQIAEAAKKEYEEAKAELDRLEKRHQELLDNPVVVPKAYAVSEGTPANARVHRKGDPGSLGDEAPRGFLQILGGQKLPADAKSSGRLELAGWITDPKNPLTPRVMVNRIWQFHFGKGIVGTPSDFGERGQKPTHPELLDFLAQRFIKNGWSIKSMHREMLMSRAYQLSSEDNPKSLAVDASNRLLWRYNRRRLEAEAIRDGMLAVSGSLDPTPGGEHPFPPRREWRYTQHRPFYGVYETGKRSVYLMQQRIKKHPFLEAFDGADPNNNTAERTVSTTALQALLVMNDEFIHSSGAKFARRVMGEAPDLPGRISRGYLLAYGRSPSQEEMKMCEEYVGQCRAELSKSTTPAAQQEEAALASLMRVILSSSEFLFID